MTNTKQYQYTYIATATTTQVAVGQGVLHGIVLGETAAGAITIYDESGSGTSVILGVLKASIAENTYIFDATFSKGLKIITAGASKISVMWSQG